MYWAASEGRQAFRRLGAWPHNATWFDVTAEVNKTLSELWKGKIGVREAAQQATRQAILDRGPA